MEYLKVLAISRLYLDNVENVQSSWVTQGLKVLQLGLRFGGNDVGSVMLEENVVKAAGTSNRTTEEELRQSSAAPASGRCNGIRFTPPIFSTDPSYPGSNIGSCGMSILASSEVPEANGCRTVRTPTLMML